MKKLAELRKLLGELYDKMSGSLKTAETENRSLSEEEKTQYNSWKKEYNETREAIKMLEEQEEREREVNEVRRRYVPVDTTTQGDEPSRQEGRDLDSFSLTRAIRNLLDGRPLEGVEAEMHQEGTRQNRSAGVSNGGNLVVPQIIMTRGMTGIERRDMTATGQTSVAGDQGGQMIQTNVGSIIDALRNNLVLGKAGVQMIGGLEGNISWPKFVDDDQAAEKSENAAANESSPTITSISTSPNRLPVSLEFSRQLPLQVSQDVEAWLRRYLGIQIALRMDAGGINGSGSNNQPTGILGTNGIGAVIGGTNGAAPTWEHIVDLETAVAVANAEMGTLGYLTNSKVKGKLKKTFVDDSSNAERVWDKQGGATPLNEHAAHLSNAVPSDLDKGTAEGVCSAIIYGNFADAMINQWGGVEFLVNPFSRDTEGLVRLNAWTYWDFLIQRVQSFAAMQDALTD